MLLNGRLKPKILQTRVPISTTLQPLPTLPQTNSGCDTPQLKLTEAHLYLLAKSRHIIAYRPLSPTIKMGTLLTGTIIFAAIGFLSYFLVSVLYRNDKDAQAYVEPL